MDEQNLWQLVLGELEGSLSRANFRMWFRDTFIAEDTGERVVIGVPNNFYLSWIRDKFHKNIAETLRRVRPSVREITYTVASRTPVMPVDLELTASPISQSAPALQRQVSYTEPSYAEPVVLESEPLLGQASKVASDQAFSGSAAGQRQFDDSPFQPAITDFDPSALTPPGHTPLDASRTFDTFIVGNSNRLAHAVSLAAAQEPGKKYNPLFLYGTAGLGKTHLAQAIGNQIRQTRPTAKITYVSCEAFTNEFIESLRKKDVESFKKRFRYTDVLLIDDVQFMSGKERTQEEFFHTFNALHQAKKQIVLTADREPQNIPAMEDRLTSRFAWGMVADIQPPDFETRVAILRAKCIEHNYQIEDSALQALAELIQSNIRELEGGLQQLIAKAQIENRVVSADYVQRIFAGSVTRPRGLSPNRIIDTVCQFFELKSDEVIGERRYKELVYPRQLVMYLMRHELSYSYPKIGKELGGKDHTTIMHGVEKIEKELARNGNIQSDISQLKERLYQS